MRCQFSVWWKAKRAINTGKDERRQSTGKKAVQRKTSSEEKNQQNTEVQMISSESTWTKTCKTVKQETIQQYVLTEWIWSLKSVFVDVCTVRWTGLSQPDNRRPLFSGETRNSWQSQSLITVCYFNWSPLTVLTDLARSRFSFLLNTIEM